MTDDTFTPARDVHPWQGESGVYDTLPGFRPLAGLKLNTMQYFCTKHYCSGVTAARAFV